MAPSSSSDGPPEGLKSRWVGWRNRLLSSPRFQQFTAAFPLTRPIARRHAARQFDLVSGFVQTQILYAIVECGLIEALAEGPLHRDALGKIADLQGDGLDRLLRAGAAIDLLEPLDTNWWALGSAGAELVHNHGAKAMIAHHALLYRDLADPLALLRDGRANKSELARFWDYRSDGEASPYSALMAASQPMVHAQLIEAYPFGRHRRMLDVGGGSGALIEAIAGRVPSLRFGHADLAAVSSLAKERLSTLGEHVEYHPVDFHDDPLPGGYDLICFSRILHDHDDDVAMTLLQKAAAALAPGGRVLIAEPMAQTRGAEVMGDAYFGLYLWAMGQGRPRSAGEYTDMLDRAGLSVVREHRTHQPLIVRVLSAQK